MNHVMPQATPAEIRFRISEIADWVRDFIRLGRANDAQKWAKELVRISRQLENLTEPRLRCRCAECGTEFSLHTHTVCPHCYSREWEPLPDSPCTCTMKPSSSAYAMGGKAHIISDSASCPVHGTEQPR